MSTLYGSSQLGKLFRFPLSRVESLSSHVLDLVYTNIQGVAHLYSFNGYCYFVIFVDEFSHFTWYFLMRLKYDVYAVFERFRSYVERAFSCKIKAIQFDLGGEYNKLHSTFTKLGISHRRSCAYTHKQNG